MDAQSRLEVVEEQVRSKDRVRRILEDESEQRRLSAERSLAVKIKEAEQWQDRVYVLQKVCPDHDIHSFDLYFVSSFNVIHNAIGYGSCESRIACGSVAIG
jgi:hypothetical protein